MANSNNLPLDREMNISAAYFKATQKHPEFTKKLIDGTPERVKYDLNHIRWINDCTSCCDAFSILQEEILESMEAITNHDLEQAKEEVYDSIAVLLRILDELERTQQYEKKFIEDFNRA